MKKYFLLLIAIITFSQFSTYAQAPPDSVLNKYRTSSSKEKYEVIMGYLNSFFKNDSLLIKKSLELIAYFKKQNDYSGVGYTNLCLAWTAHDKHDYTTALNIALPALSAFKERNDTTGLLETNYVLSYIYSATKNYAESIKYSKEESLIHLARNDKRELQGVYQDIGTVYAMAFIPDSGLIYAQKSLNIANELKNDSLLSGPLGTIAENYIAKEEYDLAMPFLKKASQYQILFGKKNSLTSDIWGNNAFAQLYLGMKQYDSAIHYSHRSLSFSIKSNDITQQLRTYEYLYKSFDAKGRQDSSNKYYRLAGTIKDNLLSSEKVKAIEAISFNALLRQQELNAEKIKAEDERKQNIQYVLIALGIITFLILFFLLSRSIVVNEKWISFFGILGLLIVFEFINLLIHPFLERVTHHSPILMLLALVVIASLLIPMHHRIENWIKDKMTKKNKTIRLEHAKKTIEDLEIKAIKTKEENE